MQISRKHLACVTVGFLLVIMPWPCLAQGLPVEHWSACVEATCRVTAADGGRGTGCAFERSQGCIFLLTGAHVATSRDVQCEFWRAGHQSRAVPGRVVLRDEATDVAVVAVAERDLAGHVPPIVPLAPPDWVASPGDTILSVGCAHGAWATGWQGHALGYDATDVHFVPAPANGRSGSALFDASGGLIVGLVRARAADGSRGVATSIQAVYRALGSESQRRTVAGAALPPVVLAQCAGGLCPPRGSLLPFRSQPAAPGQEAAPLYPTLPSGGSRATDRYGYAPPTDVDWLRLAEAMAGSAETQREAAQAQLEAAKAQTDYFRRQQQTAEAAEHGRIIQAVPGAASEALSQAAAGQFTQALDTATDGPMLGWLGQVIVYALLAVTGLTGVPALLVRFGVPLALRAVSKRLKSSMHTEADAVVNEIATRTARSMNGAAKRSGR